MANFGNGQIVSSNSVFLYEIKLLEHTHMTNRFYQNFLLHMWDPHRGDHGVSASARQVEGPWFDPWVVPAFYGEPPITPTLQYIPLTIIS